MLLARVRRFQHVIHRGLAGLCLAVLLPIASAHAAGRPILGSGEGTGEKPQSKLWFNDGTWWAMVHKAGKGLHFYEFDGTDWIESQFMDAELGVGGAADVKWNGQELFVLSYSSNPTLFAYTYDKRLHVFNLETGFPVRIPIASGSETMVLDQDSTGRLWATYEGGGQVHVCWSTSADHKLWFAPGNVIATGIKDDDISTVVASDRKIGVFWSDQLRWQFGFRMHRDSDPPDVWQPAEVVQRGTGCSDDHINMKADGAGNIYVVTKDLYNQMTLHYRDVGTGRWSSKKGVISGTGTRGIVMVSDADRALYVPYTVWSGNALNICLRKASYSTRTFTTQASGFISGATMNNCTGTKQVLPRGCFMTLCEGGGKTWWNGWGTLPADGPQPPAPPDSVTSEVVTRDAGTPGGGSGQLVLDLPYDEGDGPTTNDVSATRSNVRLLAAAGKDTLPSWTTGHAGTALHFDGQSGYAEITSSPALRIAGSFTLETWLLWDGTGTGTLVAKGKSSSKRNYQMLVRSDGHLELKWIASGTSQTLASAGVVPAASWHHVAGVYDQQTQKASLYIDGRLDASAQRSGPPAVSDDPLTVGARWSSSTLTDFLAGALDQTRVWQGAHYQGDFDPTASAPGSVGEGQIKRTVQISWRSPDPTQRLTYRVYRTTNGGPGVLMTPTPLAQLRFVDEAPVGGRLCYQVAAIDTLQRQGRPSAPHCIDFQDESQPVGWNSKPTLCEPALAIHACPNPFNPQTRLRLDLPASGWVRFEVYDVAGRRIALLFEGTLQAGAHHFDWTAAGPHGTRPASGIYFARVEALGQELHHKLILIK